MAKTSANSLSYRRLTKPTCLQLKHGVQLIYFRLFTEVPQKKTLKKNKFLSISTNFFEFVRIFASFSSLYPLFSAKLPIWLKSCCSVPAIFSKVMPSHRRIVPDNSIFPIYPNLLILTPVQLAIVPEICSLRTASLKPDLPNDSL